MVGQLVHAPESVNTHENAEDQFKHVKDRLEMTVWSKCLRADISLWLKSAN